IPGLCYVYSGGGWLGGPCPDNGHPYTGTATRVAGTDRYETAALLSAAAPTFEPGAVYVANGQTVIDAVVASAVATGPILLVPTGDTVPQVVLDEITRLAPTQIVIVGGTSAVTESQVAAILDAT